MRALVMALAAALTLSLAPVTAAHAEDDDWHGSARVMPSSYTWLDDMTPDADYEVLVVRGLTVGQVRRTLGVVKRRARDMTPARAEGWVMDRWDDTHWPPDLALIDRRGPAVFVYLPMWIQTGRTIARLSRHGRAVHFTTTIELDTYLTVARRGRVVRNFDAGFRPPRKGALPAERGLDWGSPHQNIWATAWAFNERVSRIHVSQKWFESPHPAYVFKPARG